VFVDADVGQKDVGPPAAITRGYLRLPHDPYSLQMDGLFFVGATTPIRHLLPMVLGTASIVQSAGDAFAVINTTGFVQGIGHALKSYKIESLRPDVLLAVDPGDETAAIISSYPYCRSVRLVPTHWVTTKSRAMRRDARQRAFAVYFDSSPRVDLSIQAIAFQRNPYFANALRQAARRRASLPQRYLLCGLCDSSGRCLGLGILDAIDSSLGAVSFVTPVNGQDVKIVQFGDIFIKPDGEELGRTW